MDGAAIDIRFDKPIHQLGQYTAWMLDGPMSSPIDMVWTSIAASSAPDPHWLLPHGEPSVAIRRRRNLNGGYINVSLTVCGPCSFGALYTPTPTEELIGVRLKPETAATIFGVAPRDFADQAPPEAPQKLVRACARTIAASFSLSPLEIIEMLCSDLRDVAAHNADRAAPEAIAASMLRHSDGKLRCADIATHLDISERHLRRRFRDHLGCSPKTYANQIRLTSAALTAELVEKPDWARIAVGAGFHDQPHMINTFRKALGMSPDTFHRERRALSGFCNTKREPSPIV